MKYAELCKLIEKKDHIINKLPNLTAEQKAEAIAFFAKHPNYENEIDWNLRDKLTWDDFDIVISQERVSKSQLKNFVKEGVHYLKLYSDNVMTIYQPITCMGSRYLASKDVAPNNIEGEWCIAYQKERSYWDDYSFEDGRVFLFVFTASSKFALEIQTDEIDSVAYDTVFWDSSDNAISEEDFLAAIKTVTPEVSEVMDIVYSYAATAVDNYYLVDEAYDRDIEDTEIFEEWQRKAEEMKIKNFPRSFQRQVARKGYYTWDGDLDLNQLEAYGLVSEDSTKLDDRIRYFKVSGRYIVDGLDIYELVWPLEVKGTVTASDCKNLDKVVIPENRTAIDNFAFSSCSSLEEITTIHVGFHVATTFREE